MLFWRVCDSFLCINNHWFDLDIWLIDWSVDKLAIFMIADVIENFDSVFIFINSENSKNSQNSKKSENSKDSENSKNSENSKIPVDPKRFGEFIADLF